MEENVTHKSKELKIFVSRMRDHFGSLLQKVILFGSYARGDNSSESDYDVFLIFTEINPAVKSAVEEISGEMLYEYNAVFSTFLYTESSFFKKRFSPFVINAKKEGVEL